MNESCSYDAAYLTFAEFDTYGQNNKTNLPAWQIFDRKFVDDIGFNVSFFIGDVDDRGVPPYFIEADTLEELADKIDIDKTGLVTTVKQWNKYCEDGEDPDFHRGDDYMNQMFNRMRDMSLPFEKNLGPINEGPYYAAEIAPNTLGTCGGPKINQEAQIMHVSGQPIKNLYGCGNFTGFGGPGRGYGGAGGTIGPGQVFGFIAANDILEKAKHPAEYAHTVSEKPVIEQKDNKPHYAIKANEYLGISENGIGGEFAVAVKYEDGSIKDIRVLSNSETPGIGGKALDELKKEILDNNLMLFLEHQ